MNAGKHVIGFSCAYRNQIGCLYSKVNYFECGHEDNPTNRCGYDEDDTSSNAWLRCPLCDIRVFIMDQEPLGDFEFARKKISDALDRLATKKYRTQNNDQHLEPECD